MLLISENSVIQKASKNFKARRLELGFTQASLAQRSGVKLPTLRKFERTGKISLESFLKLALILDFIEPINQALEPIEETYQSIDDVLKTKKKMRKRGNK